MATIKGNERRREALLDAAERLFATIGYERTTVERILSELRIAKGTFYYYFDSKEAVLDAIVARQAERVMASAADIAANVDLSELEKIRSIFSSVDMSEKNPELIEELHRSGNAQMHLKSLVETVRRLVPILGGVVRQGAARGVFTVDHPEEAVECLLVSALVLFDRRIFSLTEEEYAAKSVAFASLSEKLLGAPVGSFSFVRDLTEKARDS